MITMNMSRARTLAAVLRRIGDGVAIAGALAATVFAFVAAVALFVMVGRLSHRRVVAGSSSAEASPPMSLPVGAEGVDRT